MISRLWSLLWSRGGRDAMLFAVGLGGVIHETVFYKGGERPSLLILFAAMLGLPIYLRHNGK